jgi:hypothetical protein
VLLAVQLPISAAIARVAHTLLNPRLHTELPVWSAVSCCVLAWLFGVILSDKQQIQGMDVLAAATTYERSSRSDQFGDVWLQQQAVTGCIEDMAGCVLEG